ncbi:hypothetical protein NDU88_002512 [Pleurodeles waltl]|uniref:Uncharacterized protein n=1 Tax=Pleurodeles waltl TaxID=8319 RepID=A0AAV7M161_PLEWA|nr:hypothetical protein NDU88_002512 [Pleurodeles waltl]
MGGAGASPHVFSFHPLPVSDSPPCPPGAPLRFSAGFWTPVRLQIKIPSSRGISGARASATAPARHRKPPRRSGRAPGPPGRTRASRAGTAPFTPRSPPRSEGGARRRPSGRDPPSGRASALTGLLAAPQPAAVDFVGDPKPTSGLPGASRSGRHLELLFTGAAGSPYEGELPAFHQFAPTDFSTGPRDTGAPCTAFFRSLGPRWLKADDGGVQSTLRVRPPS